MRMGQTRSYDRTAVSQVILDGMALQGLSCAKACKLVDIPVTTFFSWLSDDKKLFDDYARARESMIDKIADEIMEIADVPVPTLPSGATDSGAVMKQKLQIDTRKWILSKLAPRKYGDKVEVDHTGSVQVTSITRRVIDPLTLENNVSNATQKALESKRERDAAIEEANYKDIEDSEAL